MKLKAPDGVGDPCVAGVAITPRGGIYEVEPEVGALLIECFGFVQVEIAVKAGGGASTPRRGRTPARKRSAEN
jgi:hypothetical protein